MRVQGIVCNFTPLMKYIVIMRNKYNIFGFFLYFMTTIGWSQSGPGGVGTNADNQLWLSVDNNCYSDLGITLGVNGSQIRQWNDLSGNGFNAIQNTLGNRPQLNTNALNGLSTLTFNGTSDRILSSGLSTNSEVTIYVVVQFNNFTNNNDGVIQASPAGNAFTSTTNNKTIGMWINRSNGRIWGRGVQTNNSQRNISQVTSLSTGQFYIITQDFDGTNINQYVDGTIAGTVTYNNTLKDWSDFGIGRQGSESLDGDLAEVLAYNVHNNTAQRIIIENYLAAKYGLTLSANDLYTMDDPGNGDYDHDVAGIGREDASNLHNDSQGRGLVRVNNPSGMDNGEYFIWGHDNGAIGTWGSTDFPAGEGLEGRWFRVWRSSESGDVGTFDISFDLSAVTVASAADLRLLIDTDNDGIFADETTAGGGVIAGATHLGGGIYQWTGININDAIRFTIGSMDVTNSPLPVELLSFTANVNDDQVDLSWTTASEINNDFYTIERSSDGQHFEPIITVDGAGNSASLLQYFEVDFQPLTGVSYYRLKQTDFNGTFTYSSVVPVEISSSGEPGLSIFPNPISSGDQVNVQLDNLNGQEVLVVLRDMTGREVYSKVVLSVSDKHLTGVPLDRSLPAGQYLIIASSENSVYSRSIIIE